MRLTKLGFYHLGSAALTLFAASGSGNNLLYLLSGILLAVLALAAVWGRLNLWRLSSEVTLPDQLFVGHPFRLRLSARNSGRLSCWQLRLAWGPDISIFEKLSPGETASASFVVTPAYRGVNRLLGLRLESPFPLGLFRHSVRLEAEALAWPSLRERRDLSGVEVTVEGGSTIPRKGIGEELFGIRDYHETDDLRLVNWKLTAKTGRPVVNEYAQRAGQRVTLRVAGGEEPIREAASAAKFLIDTGAEVNLITSAEATGWGKGLLHLERILSALALLGEGATPRETRVSGGEAPDFAATPTTVRLFYLTTGLVFLSLFQIEELPARLLLVLSPAFALGWLLEQRPSWRPPDRAWSPLSAAMLVWGAFFGWRRFGVTISTSHLLLYILVHRLLTPKGPREMAQGFAVAFLGFFLVSGLSVSLWYPLCLAGFLALAGSWLMANGDGPGRPRWAPALAAFIAISLPLAGAAFAAFPRLESRSIGGALGAAALDHLRLSNGQVVGFTDAVSLGFYGELKKSSARAMRIRVDESKSERSGQPRYVRGAALQIFDGTRWSKGTHHAFQYSQGERMRRSESGRAWLWKEKGHFVFPGWKAGETLERAEFTLYPIPTRVAFTLDAPRALESSEEAMYFDADETVYFVTPSFEGRRYAVRAQRGELGFSRFILRYDQLVRSAYLSLPSMPARVGELAERITRDKLRPLDKARAVEAYLRTHYDYSLFGEGPKSIDRFLFDSKDGNCEYFATAAAVLLRHVGVPTRLVTGYLAVEFNDYGKFYDVRQSDAHAWTEAYIEGRGWVTLDATPSASLFPASFSSLSRSLDRFIDRWRMRWYRDVIGFDSFGQRDAFQKLGEALGAVGAATVALLLGAGVLASILPWARRLRVSKPRIVSSGDFYRRMLMNLERKGVYRAQWQTGREFAGAVALVKPDLAEPVEKLTALHYRSDYAGGELTEEHKKEIQLLLERLR